MNKQPPVKERRPIPGAESEKLHRVKSKSRIVVVGVLLAVVLIAAVSVWAQSYNVSLLSGDNAEIACDGRGMQIQRTSRTSVNVICSGPSDNPQPTPTLTNPPPQPTNPPPQPTNPPPQPTNPPPQPTNPPPQPTNPPPQPTNPPPQPTTPPPTPTSPPPPPPGSNVQPYAGAPACEEIGIVHNDLAWHGIWNYEYGCHWDHDHMKNPHEMDGIFGTEYYTLAGSELSYPWQTYAGAGENFEAYVSGTMTENSGKHEGYAWHHFTNGLEICDQSLLLGTQCLDSFRVQTHQIGGEMGALTRFHSVYAEGIACSPEGAARMQFSGGAYGRTISGQFYPLTRDNINRFPAEFAGCGFGSGGGWLDFGRLNWPERGILQPLPTDNAKFANFAQFGPPEAAPYRIHPNSNPNSLDSWQSEGNVFNCLSSDPNCQQRLSVGLGLHILQGESIGMTNPANASVAHHDRQTHYWCVDPATQLFNCNPETNPGGNDNTAQALFRAWIIVPDGMDGSQYDEDGARNGSFTFHGYTNRYGDIVTNCSAPGLDCVPVRYEQFPVNDCGQALCKAAYRGSTERDSWDSLSIDGTPLQYGGTPLIPPGELWLKYPN